jgi:hypothetical protein
MKGVSSTKFLEMPEIFMLRAERGWNGKFYMLIYLRSKEGKFSEFLFTYFISCLPPTLHPS